MNTDEYLFAEDDPDLVPDSCGGEVENVVFDEEGTLPFTAPTAFVDPTIVPVSRPCSLAALDGSWNLNFRPKRSFLFGALRGPMRLEARRDVLRASGDVYFKSFVFWRSVRAAANALIDPGELEATAGIAEPGFLFRRNWYPQYPFDEYRWYFRSTGCSYVDGALQVNFRRHVWDPRADDFAGTDSGWMRFTCEARTFRSFELPRPTLQMTGEAMIGGTPYTVTATKTSPFYRGCVVEVDVMEDRSFPTWVAGQSFARIYRTAGIDLAVRMSDVDVPEDASLTTAELHALLATWRNVPGIGNAWRAWLLVGSRRAGSNTFGLMFDQTAPHREGAVGFYDARMGSGATIAPDARSRDLGEVPAAFLRTLVHEVGHVFNLYHPKHDVHRPPVGTTTMNQTGDVISFATTSNPYPDNIAWSFNEHNRMSLVHSPDPQVAPGWKEFGWGHGARFGGVPTPFDAAGLDVPAAPSELALDLDLPAEAVAGEFLMARISVTNRGSEPAEVHRNLNLAEGHVELEVTTPTGDAMELRDVVFACGDHDTVELAAGDTVSQEVQVFYTNRGHVFATPGTYSVRAVMAAADGDASAIASDWSTLTIVAPADDTQRRRAELSLDPGVGLSMALGDFGRDDESGGKLEQLAAADDDTAVAASLVLANSYGQQLRDLRTGELERGKKTRKANAAMAKALDAAPLEQVHELARAVMPAGVEADEIRAWVDAAADRDGSDTSDGGKRRAKKS